VSELTFWETVCKAHAPTYELCAICAPSHTSFLRNPSAMQDSIAPVSQQLPCAIVFYHKRFRSPSHTYKCCRPFVICCVSPTVAARVTCAFRLGSHMFPEKNTTGIVFCIGHGLLPVLVCDNATSQTVPENLRTRSSAANCLRSAVYHRRFQYD